jgi:peroxiredoxin Q/BCP
LRDDYAAFTARDAEILAIGPDSPNSYRRYWEENNLPYPGLPDPKHRVADLYGQEWNLFKFGRIPAMLLIDKTGQICYEHYSDSMKDIPENSLILAILDKINQQSR